ncbi:MAG TPA: Ni/Fe-hydrogenase cytochrome b subunit [Dehalococcoidales bacterium]|nr:Ni/Fe-hydrogenase cytochrome b subunit [Dehalococcoidales bacterium]
MRQLRQSLPIGTFILGCLVILGLIPMVLRYINGLGAISNLSDGRPWGFWISFDLYCGVALAAGGFTLAGIVYIFGREKYHSVARPAILTAFLGYLLVIFALLVDLGQPWYIWHAIIYWNVHSPLFEVAICVMTYTAVLALEFSPAVFERLSELNVPVIRRFNWRIPLRVIRAIQIPLVIAGIALSTLHQSSLGTMLLMMPQSLHPLWYTPVLPLLFLLSAISVGPAMVIFESTLSNRAFGHELAIDVLSGLARAIPYILGLYLLLKLVDLLVAGELGLIFTAYPINLLWWAEIIIGVVTPIILLSRPAIRQNRRGVFWGSVLVIFGLVLNRFNVSMLALGMRPGFTYFPHWMEVAISVALVADALLVIWLSYRFLHIAEHEEAVAE